MPNTYTGFTAAHVAEKAATVLQAELPPLAKIFTVNPLAGPELENPGLPSVVALATLASTPQVTLAPDYEDGNSTIAPITIAQNLITQVFNLAPTEYNLGAKLDWLININMREVAKAIWAVPSALLTTTNYGAAAVTAGAAAFTVGDFGKLAGSIASSQRAVVLSSAHFCRLAPTWLPPRFSDVYESGDFSAAGTNVAGFCCHPSAIIIRYATPAIGSPGLKVIDRSPVILPGLGLVGELALHVNVQSRVVYGVFSLYIGGAVGDANALKLLASA